MIPLRLVIDTDVVVSAALNPTGLERAVFLLSLARAKPAKLYVSAEILAEYRDVLSRRVEDSGTRLQFLQLIKNHAWPLSPERVLQLARDQDDDKFL